MRQQELLHLPVRVYPKKLYKRVEDKLLSVNERNFTDTRNLGGYGQRVNWCLTYESCWEIPKEWVHVKTPTLSFSFKICQWVFQTRNKKKRKDQKRSLLLWIWDIMLLSEERNSDNNLKNNKKDFWFDSTALALQVAMSE